MRIRLSFVLAAAAPGLLVAAAPNHPPEQRTAEAVSAASEAWSIAEMDGDAAYVNWLLLPGYVSVDPSGARHDKEAIVAGARKRPAEDRKTAEAEFAAYRAAHPYRSDVRLFGDTAIVSYLSMATAPGDPIKSSDIFVYRNGHWHGVYSQHSDNEKLTS